MAVKVLTTIKTKAPKNLTNIINDKVLARVQTEVIEGVIIPNMKTGSSPVRGGGRFKSYKDPDKYPGNSKSKTPVNLKKRGNLYKAYRAKKQDGKSLKMGIIDKEVAVYSKAHNDGTDTTAARRHVPLKGEEYSVKAMRRLKRIISDRILEILKGKK